MSRQEYILMSLRLDAIFGQICFFKGEEEEDLQIKLPFFLFFSSMPLRSASILLLVTLLALIYFQSTLSKTRRRHSGRLLARPNPVKCARRPRTVLDKHEGHYYFFSDDTNYRVRPSKQR